MNKPIMIIGGVALFVLGFVILFKQNIPSTNNLLSLKKETKVGTDVCGEFPKEWVALVINKAVTKTEKLESGGTNVCQYYIDESNFVTLRLNNLNFENQKKGQQSLGRSITANDKIVLNHFIAVQDNNLINDIVLEINPNLFLAIDRSSTKAANEAEIVTFAAEVAKRIQKGENQGLVSAPTVEPTKKTEGNIVPLPQETDIVHNFFNLIEERKIDDALKMMDANENTKQMWAVNFNTIESLEVKKIEEVFKEEWTPTRQVFKVELNVKVKPAGEQMGWNQGKNIRWISLEKNTQGQWLIHEIANNP